jgi:hypothetical protein
VDWFTVTQVKGRNRMVWWFLSFLLDQFFSGIGVRVLEEGRGKGNEAILFLKTGKKMEGMA